AAKSGDLALTGGIFGKPLLLRWVSGAEFSSRIAVFGCPSVCSCDLEPRKAMLDRVGSWPLGE
ncbi:hypothetical protein, partial [Leisingera sp. F5]|uniref:hypothetical protein n=1 Tax=Leisingera sp. F5 TaxID=1813816 RepID=UPI0025C54BEC